MQKLALPTILIFLLSSVVNAQDERTEYKLIDTGVLNHSTLGKGILMIIVPEPMPEGGIHGEIVQQAMPGICNFYAPNVIPYVMKKTETEDPEFVGVRINSSSKSVDQYVMQAYQIAQNECGAPLN
ncbi:hypothetical protein SAMN05444000_11356 [Shimia gijangensis]|uniref:Uncharacterized protein n=2 Tax=Shimia gijangensis TaxID=1470563 RepID=A0A1M6M7W2_9RHOB|nr:hypothetical protein SAMN05444000_11356 [Shimia gijangensis]